VTVDSPGITKNDNREFVAENDSVRFQYNFNGINAPIKITIQNKLDVPVYIDWQQSALIVNDKAIAYAPSTVPLDGSFAGSTIRWTSSPYSATSGTLNGELRLPDKIEFIPPHSYITNVPMGVTNQLVLDLPDSVFQKKKVPNVGSDPVNVKHASFTVENSPLQFKSYLTLSFGDKDARPIAFQHSFFISEIYSTGIDPSNFWFSGQNMGDQYYVRQTTGFGRGFGIVGGVALLSAVDALNQSLREKSDHKYPKN
jgi:hypothetical protein